MGESLSEEEKKTYPEDLLSPLRLAVSKVLGNGRLRLHSSRRTVQAWHQLRDIEIVPVIGV